MTKRLSLHNIQYPIYSWLAYCQQWVGGAGRASGRGLYGSAVRLHRQGAVHGLCQRLGAVPQQPLGVLDGFHQILNLACGVSHGL